MEKWKKLKIMDFVRNNSDIFTEFEIQFIKSYLDWDDNKPLLVPDLMRELYDEVGILPARQNIYLGFIKLLDDTFSLDGKTIIEIGGGILPRLGERLAAISEVKKVIVYDPRLSVHKEDTDNLKLVRKNVSQYDEIEDADLIVGLMPCKGAETIVRQATSKNIDFMIALCEGGAHGDEFDYFEDAEEWLCSIMHEAENGVIKKKMGKLKQKSLKQYGDLYPVIYNDRNGVS